jgi:NADPH:quinone reductase-like Zn-dependent oxidoreductase
LGDRVSCNNLVHWVGGPAKRDPMAIQPGITSDGMLAEEIVVDEDGIVILPDSLSYAEAATLPCAAVTAWAALTEGGRPLRPGQTVLVQGTGGVSLFGLQFAKIFGLRVIATTSSDVKAKKLYELGADHVFNYKSLPAWDAAVRDATDGRGVDRVIEVGGPATISRSVACTAYGGHLSFIGFLGGMEGSFDPLSILMGGLSLQAVGIGSRTHFEQLLDALAESATKPVIDQIFPFEDYKAAYTHLASGQHFGKIVISIP